MREGVWGYEVTGVTRTHLLVFALFKWIKGCLKNFLIMYADCDTDGEEMSVSV